MSADNRSVATDALATLGTIIDANQKRDAIHLAVIPVVAGMDLSVGDDVGIVDGVATTSAPVKLGIVDPFLKETVSEGDRFWLVIYPRVITSLRHVWTHPQIENETITGGAIHTESEKWMRNWAVKHMGYDYYGDRGTRSEDEAYAAAILAGHDLRLGPYENARGHIDDDWWYHWEQITGKRGSRGEWFPCAC